MIANFYDSFGKENDEGQDIPKEVLELLNQDLPNNFEYTKDEKTGDYHVTPKSDMLSQGVSLSMDIDFEEIEDVNLKEKLKMLPKSKWRNYLYRIQKSVPVKNAKIGNNKDKIAMEKMIGDPFDESGEILDMIVCPTRFDKPRKLHFETVEGEKIDVDIQQQPYDSITEIKYSSINFPAFKMEIYLYSPLLDDESTAPNKVNHEKSRISYSLTPKKAACVQDAVAAINIFRGLCYGNVKINGVTMSATNKSVQINEERLKSTIEFWTELKKIEDILDISFIPSAEFSVEDSIFLKELSLCLLKEKNISWLHPFDHFHLGNFQIKENEPEKIIEKEGIYFDFLEGPIHATLLGAEFDLYSKTKMVDFVITNIKWDNEKKDSGEFYISDAPNKVWKLIRRYIPKKVALNS